MTTSESATKGTTPYAVKTVSKDASAKGRARPSHWTNGTRLAAGHAGGVDLDARSRTMPADRSVATTVAPWAASQREHWPEPAPISSTPGRRGSPSSRHPPRAAARGPRRSRCRRGTTRARRSTTPASPSHHVRFAVAVSAGGAGRRVASVGVLTAYVLSFDPVLTARIGLPSTSVCARSMLHLSTRRRGAEPCVARRVGPQSNCPQSEFLLHDCQHGREDRA